MCNKRNKPITSNRKLKFLILTTLCFLMYLPSTATAYSTSFDFGPVALGATSTTTVTIHNEGNDAVEVTGVGFVAQRCPYFSIVFLTESKQIPAGEALQIDVNYSPSAVGECSNELRIWTDDSPVPHTVALSGTGVETRASVEDKIQEIFEYLDTHIKGKGPGKSAENRFNALRNMIEAAAVHIKNGQTEAALHKLSAIYNKVDGFSKPMDFIDERPAYRMYSSNTLAGLIKDLMTLLESDATWTGKRAKSKETS